nr:uncharacterized protein LOC117277725 [Nicotiana tomentosiformis]
MYFPNKEISFIGEDITKRYDGWRLFFVEAANLKRVGIRAVLVSNTGQHYPISAKLRFPCSNNIAEYEASILGLRLAIDINIEEILVIGGSDMLIHQENNECGVSRPTLPEQNGKGFQQEAKTKTVHTGQLVLKWIFPHRDEAKGKFSPNCQGPYMVHRVVTGGTLILSEIDREIWPKPINSTVIKRYYV